MTALALLTLVCATSSALPADRFPLDDISRGLRNVMLLAHQTEKKMQHHPYIGMWITADGHIRQAFLPNGRYDEARGNRQSAYQGRYEITGNRIDYWDDSGFSADGVFVNHDELHHGGMVFYRKK
ncbi:Atu4866 domain-containing protein [Brenneria izbisi]|uniref:Atu4866 domain-containing protein n=1 Tax=Brenneria izbisi TaxID=2939450 RepID=A0AA42C2Z1_9GAMM|nr:Atu4866 domain-containing protein [Brenneria izbisi]MCV9880073.1 Atu4866 domain-containing protein [Brenneria izbisi]MCV9883462.1 Atu4866 domain-containing protein [Brenneria izbisi]